MEIFGSQEYEAEDNEMYEDESNAWRVLFWNEGQIQVAVDHHIILDTLSARLAQEGQYEYYTCPFAWSSSVVDDPFKKATKAATTTTTTATNPTSYLITPRVTWRFVPAKCRDDASPLPSCQIYIACYARAKCLEETKKMHKMLVTGTVFYLASCTLLNEVCVDVTVVHVLLEMC